MKTLHDTPATGRLLAPGSPPLAKSRRASLDGQPRAAVPTFCQHSLNLTALALRTGQLRRSGHLRRSHGHLRQGKVWIDGRRRRNQVGARRSCSARRHPIVVQHDGPRHLRRHRPGWTRCPERRKRRDTSAIDECGGGRELHLAIRVVLGVSAGGANGDGLQLMAIQPTVQHGKRAQKKGAAEKGKPESSDGDLRTGLESGGTPSLSLDPAGVRGVLKQCDAGTGRSGGPPPFERWQIIAGRRDRASDCHRGRDPGGRGHSRRPDDIRVRSRRGTPVCSGRGCPSSVRNHGHLPSHRS